MSFNPSIHHRRSIRLRKYDYSERGLYFITVCTHGRNPLFGRIHHGKMIRNAAGDALWRVWKDLPQRFPSIEMMDFIVMPNHIHGIIAIVRSGLPRIQGAASSAPTNAPTLGKIMRAFKSLSAIEVNRILHKSHGPLWQRNYYEHIIRSGDDLTEIQNYIAQNPLRWSSDPDNPLQSKSAL